VIETSLRSLPVESRCVAETLCAVAVYEAPARTTNAMDEPSFFMFLISLNTNGRER
jgi:hypothetical protein